MYLLKLGAIQHCGVLAETMHSEHAHRVIRSHTSHQKREQERLQKRCSKLQ